MCLTVIVVECDVYIICCDTIKIKFERIGLLIPSEWDGGASMWKILKAIIHICPVRETWNVLEGTCLKMVQIKY